MSYWTKRRKIQKQVDDLIAGLNTDDGAICDSGSIELPGLVCAEMCPDFVVDGELPCANMCESIAVFNQPVSIVPAFSNHNDDFDDFFSHPLESSNLGIYIVSDLSNEISARRLSDFGTKNVLLPYKDTFVVIPMLNVP